MTNLRPVCLSGCSRRVDWVEKWHDLGAHGLRLGGSDHLSLWRIRLQPGTSRAPPAGAAGHHLLRHMHMPPSGWGEFIIQKKGFGAHCIAFLLALIMPVVRFLKGENYYYACWVSVCCAQRGAPPLCFTPCLCFHRRRWRRLLFALSSVGVVNELANHYYYACTYYDDKLYAHALRQTALFCLLICTPPDFRFLALILNAQRNSCWRGCLFMAKLEEKSDLAVIK